MLLLALLACRPAPPPPDVYLLVVDALRADRVDASRRDRPTPAIDALRGQALTFSRAFAHGPDTRAALPALLSGLSAEGPWLGERFAALGYQTALFSGNAWVQDPLTRGFQELRPTEYSYLGARRVDGQELVDDFAAWLDAADDRPALVYLHWMDVHAPLRPPVGYAGRYASAGEVPATNGAVRAPFPDDQRQRLADRYDEAVAWTDALVGQALAVIERRGRPSVVVLTADHGEALGEHDQLGHGGALTPELLRVPLILSWPGTRPRTVDAPVGHLDVLPTLLVAAGAPEDLPGTDLGGALPGDRRLPIQGVALDSGRTLRGEIAWPWLLTVDGSLNLETGEPGPAQPLLADHAGFRDIEFREDASGRLRALGYQR